MLYINPHNIQMADYMSCLTRSRRNEIKADNFPDNGEIKYLHKEKIK